MVNWCLKIYFTYYDILYNVNKVNWPTNWSKLSLSLSSLWQECNVSLSLYIYIYIHIYTHIFIYTYISNNSLMFLSLYLSQPGVCCDGGKSSSLLLLLWGKLLQRAFHTPARHQWTKWVCVSVVRCYVISSVSIVMRDDHLCVFICWI